jgi:predicted negative regulator of RcsB-dependent stress response
MEFYRRLKHAESKLEGANSDRGRIYILLGEPFENKNYSGHQNLVDCELWIFLADGRPGLPPRMHLIFYRPKNFGKFRQFYPGVHSALDIISPGYSTGSSTKLEAYRTIRGIFPELAQATASIIPGEGDPVRGVTLTSSGSVIAQIHTLPEREIERNYLKNFATLEGIIDVTYSAKEISGNGLISVSENKGFKFLNYSVMPDVIHTKKIADNLHTANISINLRVEDLEGKTIHQQERNINLQFDEEKKKSVTEERKIVFKDFAPIVEGEYNVSVTFSNKNKEGYYVHRERINITDDTVPILIGFQIKNVDSGNFLPFSIEGYKVVFDPRLIFNKDDSLVGLILSEQKPSIHLMNVNAEDISIEVVDVEKQGNFFVFRQPLENIKSDNYFLSIKNEKNEIYKKIISVMPFLVEKPHDFERSEDASSEYNYIFVIAQQYLNKGDVDKSLEYFNKIPENLWNSRTIPILARAYYSKKDYERVVELLDKETVIKDYSVLVLLANSFMELNRKQRAADYFEILRKYGDTAQINKILGDIYFSLGEKEKAEVYWERAKKLENSERKNLSEDKEK